MNLYISFISYLSILFVSAFVCLQPVIAEIRTDGTLGPAEDLTGPDYDIHSGFGQQHGNNLFHSFEVFNIGPNEKAVFSGPDSVENVISRVTGGTLSHIDGWMSCTIPNANFFLINPAGIILSENTILEIDGSLHVSTADYLRLGTTGRFDALEPVKSVLTWEPPTAFGFVDDDVAEIHAENLDLQTVGDNSDISFIGGDVTFRDFSIIFGAGKMNVVAISAQGEVALDNPDTTLFDELGDVIMDESAFMLRSSEGSNYSGEIYIRGGNIMLTSSYIDADSYAGNDNSIDIDATDTFTLNDGSTISSTTNGTGQGADMKIAANTLDISGQSKIYSFMYGEKGGKGSNLIIDIDNLKLWDSGKISIHNDGAGTPGDLIIDAKEAITISDNDSIISSFQDNATVMNKIDISAGSLNITDGYIGADRSNIFIKCDESAIISHAGHINMLGFEAGEVGSIEIYANSICLESGGKIYSSPSLTGDSGDIRLTANTDVKIDSDGEISSISNGAGRAAGDILIQAPHIQVSSGRILASCLSGESSGKIEIKSKTLTVQDGGVIESNVKDSGISADIDIETEQLTISGGGSISAGIERELSPYEKALLADDNLDAVAGTIHITAHESITFHGTDEASPNSGKISVSSAGVGKAGDIAINTPQLNMENSGYITAEGHNQGDAGNIIINANQVNLSQNSKISSKAQSANGGNITLTAENSFIMDESSITTSVKGGAGNGGNISIDSGLMVLRISDIIAKAIGGNGGNIAIAADHLIKDAFSIVDASSRLGIDGNIDISAPNVDFSTMTPLSLNFGPADSLNTTSCDAQNINDNSSLLIKRKRRSLEPEIFFSGLAE